LALVAVHDFSRNTTKEDSRVQLAAVDDAFQLQHEIAVLTFGFKLPSAVLHIKPALFGHGEFARQVGISFPPGQILTVEQALRAKRLEANVAEGHLAFIELQTEMPASKWFRILVL